MRIAYCTNVRLPTERAHGHEVARVCDAMVKAGHEVSIFSPYRRNPVRQEFHEFHEVDGNVLLTCLGSFDPIDRRWIPKVLQLPILNAIFNRELYLALRRRPFNLLYTRTPALLFSLLMLRVPIVLELHTLPRRGRRTFARKCNRCRLIVCLTSPMRDELVAMGVDAAKVTVEPDAVDAAEFIDAQPMHIEGTRPFVGYAGQLETMGLSKGIPELLDALVIVRANGYTCRGIVAGPPPRNDALVDRLRRQETYMGFLPPHNVRFLLAACDILVYPAPKSDHPFYVRDTSPLKIFEYMAAGKPIVTADLPPIRDVLDESTAWFCSPGDPADLARAIMEVIDHPDEAKARADKAQTVVRERYTWGARMKRILERMERNEKMERK